MNFESLISSNIEEEGTVAKDNSCVNSTCSTSGCLETLKYGFETY